MRPVLLSVLSIALCVAVCVGGAPPQSGETGVPEGIQALKAGEYGTAERIFQRAVNESPTSANFAYLAMSESGEGNPEAAITHFRRSIELGNHSAGVYYDLGLADLRTYNTTQGVRDIQRALSIDPTLKPALYTLAVTLLDAGRPEEAIPFLTKAREESPCDARIWANLARAQFAEGNTQAALQTVDTAVNSMPANLKSMVTLAVICSHFNQFQKARYLLENASESLPEDNELKVMLAKTSLQAKEPVEAFAVLEGVPPDAAAPGEVPYVKGVALALTGRQKDALAQFSLAVSADSHNARYLIAQAWGFQLGAQHEQALDILNQAATLYPDSPIIQYRQAVSLFLLRKYQEAASRCDQAIRLAPTYDGADLLLGMAKLEQGDLAAAQAAVRQAVALKPDNSLYHRELGVVLFKEGDIAGSKKEIDQAILQNPKAAEAYFWRARVLISQGHQREAVADLETALALQPTLSLAYSDLAELYTKLGEPDKAAALLAKQRELAATPESEDRSYFLSDLNEPPL
jgi:tetratricopeptide (TPR) repeat protein